MKPFQLTLLSSLVLASFCSLVQAEGMANESSKIVLTELSIDQSEVSGGPGTEVYGKAVTKSNESFIVKGNSTIKVQSKTNKLNGLLVTGKGSTADFNGATTINVGGETQLKAVRGSRVDADGTVNFNGATTIGAKGQSEVQGIYVLGSSAIFNGESSIDTEAKYNSEGISIVKGGTVGVNNSLKIHSKSEASEGYAIRLNEGSNGNFKSKTILEVEGKTMARGVNLEAKSQATFENLEITSIANPTEVYGIWSRTSKVTVLDSLVVSTTLEENKEGSKTATGVFVTGLKGEIDLPNNVKITAVNKTGQHAKGINVSNGSNGRVGAGLQIKTKGVNTSFGVYAQGDSSLTSPTTLTIGNDLNIDAETTLSEGTAGATAAGLYVSKKGSSITVGDGAHITTNSRKNALGLYSLVGTISVGKSAKIDVGAQTYNSGDRNKANAHGVLVEDGGRAILETGAVLNATSEILSTGDKSEANSYGVHVSNRKFDKDRMNVSISDGAEINAHAFGSVDSKKFWVTAAGVEITKGNATLKNNVHISSIAAKDPNVTGLQRVEGKHFDAYGVKLKEGTLAVGDNVSIDVVSLNDAHGIFLADNKSKNVMTVGESLTISTSYNGIEINNNSDFKSKAGLVIQGHDKPSAQMGVWVDLNAKAELNGATINAVTGLNAINTRDLNPKNKNLDKTKPANTGGGSLKQNQRFIPSLVKKLCSRMVLVAA